jgi:hypothetical protein
MEEKSPRSLPVEAKTSSRAWALLVAGYSTAAVGLVAFLTINGASGVPNAATLGTAILIAVGLLLPAVGMLLMRRSTDSTLGAARYGFVAQAFGLIVLFFGVLLAVIAPSLSGYLISAVLIVTSAILAIAGAALLRNHYIRTRASNASDVGYLVLGTALIFLGAGLIAASNIAFEYIISQVQNTIYVDLGATAIACGCVVAAYSFFILHSPLNLGKPSH